MLDRVPLRLLGPLMRTISYLIYDLDLDLSRFGVVKDEFGSAMVTNVGVFGLAQAPSRRSCPSAGRPWSCSIGEVEDRVGRRGRPAPWCGR